MAVLCALTSSTISRLRKTWDGLPAKYRIILDTLRKATEHGRNYAEYRAKIRSAVPPCLPFVGLFLTDLTLYELLSIFTALDDTDATFWSSAATRATAPRALRLSTRPSA